MYLYSIYSYVCAGGTASMMAIGLFPQWYVNKHW